MNTFTQKDFGEFPFGEIEVGSSQFLFLESDNRNNVDSNNKVQNAIYINPVTKDFELNDNGLFKGMSSIVQMVQLALTTNLGSSVDSGLGININKIKVINASLKTDISGYVNSALTRLISANLISLQKVDVKRESTNKIFISISWLDLTENTAFTTQLGSTGVLTNKA
jgi:hypothetical protein